MVAVPVLRPLKGRRKGKVHTHTFREGGIWKVLIVTRTRKTAVLSVVA